MEGLDDATARELANGLRASTFPEDYIGWDYEGEVMEIPVTNEEVSMYRELEGVFVMIGTERLFFNNPAYAKFIFYAAKAGLRQVRVPEAKIARKANRGIEQEIEDTVAELERRAGDLNISGAERSRMVRKALETMGAGYYADIVLREDMW